MGKTDKATPESHDKGEEIKVTIGPKPHVDEEKDDKKHAYDDVVSRELSEWDTTESADDTSSLDDEKSSVEEELGRIEGIESTQIADIKKGSDDSSGKEDDVDDIDGRDFSEDDAVDSATEAVDLDKVMEDAKRNNPVVQEIRAANDKKKKRHGALVTALLCVVIALGAGAAAGYFYLDADSARNDNAKTESDLKSAKSRIASLETQVSDAEEAEAAREAEADASAAQISVNEGYREITELGVRFKESEATKGLLFGYIASNVDAAADAVAVSTKPLVKLSVGEGASVAYPCAFAGNVPTITRYQTDVKIGEEQVSKIGKKIGDAFYVYAAPAGNCAPSEAQAQQSRNDAARAVYDALEAIPVVDAPKAE